MVRFVVALVSATFLLLSAEAMAECGKETVVREVDSQLTLARTPQFKTGSSELTVGGAEVIDEVGAYLVCYDYLTLHVTVFGDYRGQRQRVAKLMEARAQTIVDRLVTLGVSPSRIQATSKMPPAVKSHPRETMARRWGKRRVEMRVREPVVRVAEGQLLLRDGIRFKLGTDELHETSSAPLDVVAKELTARPAARLRIEVHTDPRGDRKVNLDLSTQRASAIRDALVERGIAPARLTAKGYGDTRPITGAPFHKLRRIELHLE